MSTARSEKVARKNRDDYEHISVDGHRFILVVQQQYIALDGTQAPHAAGPDLETILRQ